MASGRKRPFSAEQALDLILDSDEEDIANDSYNSSELETESDDDSAVDAVVHPVGRC